MAKKKPVSEEQSLRTEFTKSTVITTEEIELLRINARDNILARFAQKLKDIQSVDKDAAKAIVDNYALNVPKHEQSSIKSVSDVINHVYDYFDYYHAITTQEELKIEFDRAKKFVFYEGIDLPIVVEFDYQYFTERAIFQKPTFYSY